MTQQTYKIGNMDCANCAREVETGVSKLPGVDNVRVDFSTSQMVLDGEVDYETLRQRVEALGKILESDDKSAQVDKVPERGGFIGFWDYLVKRIETRIALFGGAGILLTLIASVAFALDEPVSGLFYTFFMLIVLLPIARSGLNTLRINQEFNINLLMTIAAIGAVIIGEYLESAMVIFLFTIGEALEGYTADRARASLRSLMDLAPQMALRVGSNQPVPVSDLVIGDALLVKPGERIPMDAIVTAGSSGVNQAPITGESMPVHRTDGDTVYAGSINGEGALEIEVTHLAQDNTLSRIISMVEEAQSQRAPSQRLIDRFAHYYTPAVVVLALLVATVPPLLFNAPFFDTAAGHGWFYRALSMLVIACPCALVISTPVTIIASITAAARRGVLIKGGVHLEALGRVQALAFDKTGTLTTGKPTVIALRSIDCETGEPCAVCDDVLALAAAVEQRSTHPLAQAVVAAAEEHNVLDTYSAADVTALAGQGVQGWVDGNLVTVGSHSLFDAEHPHAQAVCDWIDQAEAQGQTAMLLCDGERVRGYITVADQPRDDSAKVIGELNTLDLKTIMLTGDNSQAAQAIGQRVGVQDVRANLLPQDKVAAVESLLREYEQVAMIGDGINDTPALAAATVGIAMGGAGSAQALETADIALLADDLNQLPYAIKLAQFARQLIKQNVILSFGLKLIFLLLALTGGISLWAAVFADVGMSIIVTLNGMRPLRQQ